MIQDHSYIVYISNYSNFHLHDKQNPLLFKPYLPSKASPVTETQSGQPRPSPVLTRVSRVPLCRLLRCQPVKTRKMKRVSRDSKRIIGHRVFSPFTRGSQIDFLQTSLAVSNKPENGQYVHLFVNEKEGYEKYSRLISRYISRDNGVCGFLSKERNFRDNSEIQIRSTIRTNIKLIFYGKEERGRVIWRGLIDYI